MGCAAGLATVGRVADLSRGACGCHARQVGHACWRKDGVSCHWSRTGSVQCHATYTFSCMPTVVVFIEWYLIMLALPPMMTLIAWVWWIRACHVVMFMGEKQGKLGLAVVGC